MDAPGFKTMPIVKQKRDRLNALRNERASFVDHWRDLSDHILPRRARFFTTDRNKGTKRNDKIIDSTATLAARTLSAGMMAGLTSPARPWFRLLPHNLELLEDGAVRDWLWEVEAIMRDVFTRSNLYDALPLVYTDLGVFGTAALQIVEDEDDVIRAHTLPVGSYMVASDYAGRVCTLFREYQMTVGNLVEKYGYDKVTASTKNLWDAGKVDAWVEVVDAIEKNLDHNPRYEDATLKAWKLVCFEASGSDDDQPLEESGYDEFPCMVTRWTVTGEDIYGNSPAFDALPDVRQLQLMQKRKLLAVEKMVNPAMILSPELENRNFSILPGALNYGRSMTGAPAAMPVHPLNLQLNWLLEDITQVQERIRRAFYEDLFLMLSLSDRRNITAREVEERHEEKLLQLGPVLERVNDELLDPLIDRVFSILLRRGMIPEPPESIAGSELRVEYVSIMAQAQKVVHTASVDKFLSFVGAVAGLDPGVIDMVDFDEAVEDYGEQLGISPKLILSSDEVAEKRAARAKAEQEAKTQQTMFAMADAAQKMGNTPMEGDTALSRVMNAAGPAIAAQAGAPPA